MASKVKGIPDGASVVIPRLVCRDPAAAIEFCASTFGAVERVRRPGPDGKIAHALMTIGPAMVMIEGEWPTLTSRAPKPDGRGHQLTASARPIECRSQTPGQLRSVVVRPEMHKKEMRLFCGHMTVNRSHIDTILA